MASQKGAPVWVLDGLAQFGFSRDSNRFERACPNACKTHQLTHCDPCNTHAGFRWARSLGFEILRNLFLSDLHHTHFYWNDNVLRSPHHVRKANRLPPMQCFFIVVCICGKLSQTNDSVLRWPPLSVSAWDVILIHMAMEQHCIVSWWSSASDQVPQQPAGQQQKQQLPPAVPSLSAGATMPAVPSPCMGPAPPAVPAPPPPEDPSPPEDLAPSAGPLTHCVKCRSFL